MRRTAMKGRPNPSVRRREPATYCRSVCPVDAAAWIERGWVTSEECTRFRKTLVIQRML